LLPEIACRAGHGSRTDDARTSGGDVGLAAFDGSDEFGRQLPLILQPLLQPLAHLCGLPYWEPGNGSFDFCNRAHIDKIASFEKEWKKRLGGTSSLAIQIGSIGALAPDRRNNLARIGLRVMVGRIARLRPLRPPSWAR